MMKNYLLLLALFSFSITRAQQTILMGASSSVSTCSAIFYDSGDSIGNYAPNEYHSITISSDQQNFTLGIYSNLLNLGTGDTLRIYNGNSITAPLVATYTSSDNLVDFYIAANFTNSLTFEFKSDNNNEGSGWLINVICYRLIIASNNSTSIDSIACGGILIDDGLKGDYSNNQSIVQTLTPSGSGVYLSLYFSEFSLAYGDRLIVYNGASTLDEILGEYDYFTTPQTYLIPTNPQGALTIAFITDNSNTSSGFQAYVVCNTFSIPNCVTELSPESNDTAVSTNAIITWKASFGPATGFDVYFGTSPNPPLVSSNQQNSYYIPAALNPNTIYYYKILPRNSAGIQSSCGSVQFKTKSMAESYATNLGEVNSIRVCEGIFYDNGGPLASYNNNANRSFDRITFFPSVNGNQILISFTDFSIAQNDKIKIYNGPSAFYPLIYEGNNPGIILANNLTGALTVEHKYSSMFSFGLGWKADVRCVPLGFNFMNAASIDSVATCDGYLFDKGGPAMDDYFYETSFDTLILYPVASSSKVILDFYQNPTLLNISFFNGVGTSQPIHPSNLGVFQNETNQFGIDNLGTRVKSSHSSGALTLVIKNTGINWLAKIKCSSPSVTPACVNTIYPRNGWTINSTFVELGWYDEGDGIPTSYDVYFGNTTNPTLVSSNQITTTYLASNLLPGAKYYWKVIAKNLFGVSVGCTLDSFLVSNNYYQKLVPFTDGVVQTCEASIFDQIRQDQKSYLTLKPTIGSKSKLEFVGNNLIAIGDTLAIYNGPTKLSPLLKLFTGETLTGTFVSSAVNGELTLYANSYQSQSKLTRLQANVTCFSTSLTPLCVEQNSPLDTSYFNSTNPTLSWKVSQSGGGVPTSYDVYFGTSTNPPLVSSNQIGTSFIPGPLDTSTTYYWRVVAKNSFGNSQNCKLYSFTTWASPVVLDLNPYLGQAYQGGGIQLNYNSSGLDKVDFSYSADTGKTWISFSRQNIAGNSYVWVPIPTAEKVFIKISSSDNAQINDTIGIYVNPTVLNIVRPFEGEEVLIDQYNFSLQWTTSSPVNVQFGANSNIVGVTIKNEAKPISDSYYTYDAFAPIPPSYPINFLPYNFSLQYPNLKTGYYKFKIGVGYGKGAEMQNPFFLSEILLSSFDTGGVYIQGSTHPVETNTSITEEYTLEFSSDGGLIWSVLTYNYQSNQWGNGYIWTLPNITSNLCLLRLTKPSTPGVIYDQSDEPFSIQCDYNANIFPSGPLLFCEGQSVLLSLTSSIGSYQWYKNGILIPGATASNYLAIDSGDYSVSVTNNGCAVGSNTLRIAVQGLPSANIINTGNSTICAGTSTQLTATSGIGYTYQWKQNGNALSGAINSTYTANASGIYTVEVTANGCAATSNPININVQTLPTASISNSGNNTICAGSSTQLTATSGLGYTYQWKQNGNALSGATNSTYTANASGIYTVDVTANGCSSSSNAIAISVNALPIPQIIGSDSICKYTTTSLTISAVYAAYLWSTNNSSSTITVSPGNYSVLVTDSNGCTNTASFNIATITVDTAVVQLNDNQLQAAASGANFQWINCNGSITATADTFQMFLAVANGNYAVVVSQNGCADTSNCHNITNVGYLQVFNEERLLIYPNPSDGIIKIEYTTISLDEVIIKVMDANSRSLITKKYEGKHSLLIDLDLSDLPSSVYFLELSSSGRLYHKKIVLF